MTLVTSDVTTARRLDAIVTALNESSSFITNVSMRDYGRRSLERKYARAAREVLRKYELSDVLRAYCTIHTPSGGNASDRPLRLLHEILRHHVKLVRLVHAVADIEADDPATARILVSDVVSPVRNTLFGPRDDKERITLWDVTKMIAAPVSDLLHRQRYTPPNSQEGASMRGSKAVIPLFRSDAPGRLTRAAYLELFSPYGPTRNQYLTAHVDHADLQKDQRDLALVLCSDWEGTLDSLLETARELHVVPTERRSCCPSRKLA